ncbi:MAG: FAD-dependent thymidylate synthase [Acidobacteria bacterium]|jgi:flavin-dependent thymidylate synthase|nr:FAD-dependent thymidylate synthase [Acidobacteriota bacterium]
MKVRLVNAHARPFDNVVAAARSCYSQRAVTAEMAAGEHLEDPVKQQRTRKGRERIARSIFEAGHHTTYQHAYFQFIIEGVSRLTLWSFLHSHQFYNSEQVSQRYVTVDRNSIYVPPALKGRNRSHFCAAVEALHSAYQKLTALLEPVAQDEILRTFPTLKRPAHAKRLETKKRRRAQEVARYVLPLATTAHLHHTVSALTLLRYRRACAHPDVPDELRKLADALIDALLAVDPSFAAVLEDPIPVLPAASWLAAHSAGMGETAAYRQEFDRNLGPLSSRLLHGGSQARGRVAAAVRAVTGRPLSALSDDEAVRLVLDPQRNPLLAETLNLGTLDPLSRALHQATFTFATKISHTADSQNQRHRMVPGARPVLSATVDEEPDFITPTLIRENTELCSLFEAEMHRAWEAASWLRRHGPDPTLALYLLPNAVAVRLIETADLLHLHHKMRMRLCWNAQDEIRRAAWEQAMQIADVDPLIGSFLAPPCTVRKAAGRTPYCPEGDRFCGVPVWKLSLGEQRPPGSSRSADIGSR